MELDATHVQCFVAQRHNLPFVANSCDFDTLGQAFARNHPRMIAPNGDVTIDAAEYGVIGYDVTGRGYTVKDVAQILKLSAKGLANGLMTEADTEDGLLTGISTDDVK